MRKSIRSISIADSLDEELKEDSRYRGLTISANISRILFDYFQQNSIKPFSKGKRRLKVLSTKRIPPG
jgi:hypothetical protein